MVVLGVVLDFEIVSVSLVVVFCWSDFVRNFFMLPPTPRDFDIVSVSGVFLTVL